MSSKPDAARDLRVMRASLAGVSPGQLVARFGLSPSGIRAAIKRATAAARTPAAAGATATDREARA